MTFPFSGWRAGLPLILLPVAAVPPGPLQAGGAEPVVRVLLQEGPTLELSAVGSSPLLVGDGRGRTLLRLPPGERLRLRRGDSGLRAELMPARGASAGATRAVPLPLQEAWIDPAPGSNALLVLKDRRFRGRLQIRPQGSGLQAINYIGVESYLSSVVGSEMPAAWPQAALRAQAVAARTYALSKRKPSAPFDLKATVASQVYKGVEAETASTRQAVASTRSQVLMHGSQLINAVFHSSSGGSTENSGEIWSRQLPYLVSVPDFDERSPARQWEKVFRPSDLRRAFPETGGVSRIDVLSTTSSGRIRQARVVGPSGALLVKGADLRQRLGLRSTLARFEFVGAGPSDGPGIAAVPLATRGPVPLPVLPAGRNSPASGKGRRPSGTSSLSSLLDSISSPAAAPAPVRRARYSTSPGPSSGAAPTLRVIGRGFGHGVGMSQWGAYGLALRGQGYQEILRHFYRGAQLTPYSPR